MKNQYLIFIGNNDKLICDIYKKNIKRKIKILILNTNILSLEKYYSTNKKITIYPFNINNEKKNNFLIFSNLLKKKGELKEIIIYSTDPIYAIQFNNLKFNNLINLININLNLFLNILIEKKQIIKDKKIIITFILHKEKKYKNTSLCMNIFLNELFYKIMFILNEEYKNKIKYKINCFITENIKLKYKKNIYPFKKDISLKNIKLITKAYFYIINNNINNKIIII